MKFSYLIDTDWIIHYLNGNRNIVSKLRSLENEGLTVSVAFEQQILRRCFRVER